MVRDGYGWSGIGGDGLGWVGMVRDRGGWSGIGGDGLGWVGMVQDRGGCMGMLAKRTLKLFLEISFQV